MLVPQSNRQPVQLTDEEVQAALAQPNSADNSDLFATDPNREIRTLGLLALRRSDINDTFALGDMCVRRAISSDNRLLVFYVGKALIAYRKAEENATDPDDHDLAQTLIREVVEWTVRVAREHPTRRNVAVALWAAAEDTSDAALTFDDLEALFDAYLRPPQPSAQADPDRTRAADESRTQADLDLLLDSDVTVVDYGDDNLYTSAYEHGEESVADIDPAPAERDDFNNARLISALIDGTRETGEFEGEFRIGDYIDQRYEVVEIRRGGMGVVYLCYDHDQREPVAIKTFLGRFLNNERAVTRFNYEAVTWINLEKHQHVVQARLVQNIAGRPHIILEHISGLEGLGPDLRSWIDHNRLDLAQAVEFGLHITLGMQHATQKVPGLVHRDLKPANILVTHDGIAKVTDFGLVRSLELEDIPIAGDNTLPARNGRHTAPLTRVGAIVGTAPYMSPEQCQSRPVDTRSDIYSFGCLLYEMLTGHYVFEARKFPEWLTAHSNQTPVFAAPHSQNIPEDLQNLVLFCLEKEPNNRPASWGDIVDTLSSIYHDIAGRPAILKVTGPALQARELMDKGYSLTELGRLEEALEAYDRAIELQPDYAWAWARKGRTYRLLTDYDAALACYDRALEIQPQYAFAWNGKGIVLERMGKLEAALACYETAAQINPADVWHWCNQADALQSLERHNEAIAVLEKALEIDPLHPNSWARLGQIKRLQHNYTEAIDAYARAIELAPEYAWAQNGYGIALKLAGRLEDALVSFKKAARYQPDEVWHWYNILEVLVELGHHEEAVFAARQATQTDPTHVHSWSKLGQVLRYLHRYDEALEAYDRAIELQPDHSWAINGKGMVLERMGRYEEALACYQQAAASDEDEAPYTYYSYNQGNVLVMLKRFEDAIPLLERATQINPKHARSWTRLGSAYRHTQRYDDALQAYQQATRIDANYAWAWNELGSTFEALGKYSEALQAYKQANLVAPTDALYLYQQANVLVYMTEYQQALDLLDLALKLDSRSARIWAKHGQVLRRLSRFEDALASYTRAIELDPDYAWAWNGRGLTLSAMGQHVEALASFQNAAQADPDDVWHWYNQGDELVIMGRLREAVNVLDHALTLDPTHAESWVKRGLALRRLGQFNDALAAYDQALHINPRYDWAWNGRGLVLQLLGRREEALLSYQRALEEDASIMVYYTNQVEVLLDLQRKEEALQVIDQALALQADNANAWARRGQVLRRLERYEEAIDSYHKALEIDETYAWAWNGQGLAYAALERWPEAISSYELAVHYSGRDVWFWHNYGEALYMIGAYEQAQSALQKALSLDPNHEASIQKLKLVQAKLKEEE